MRVRDMTRGSSMGLILSTALPLMLGNMFPATAFAEEETAADAVFIDFEDEELLPDPQTASEDEKTEEPEGWTAIQDDIEDTLRKT